MTTPAPNTYITVGTSSGTLTAVDVSDPQRPYLTVCDADSGQALRCYIPSWLLGEALKFLGEAVRVRGEMVHDAATARLLHFDEALAICAADAPTFRFEDARGVSPWQPGDPRSEDVINAIRNGTMFPDDD